MGHTSGKSVRPFFDSGRLLRVMMMFQQKSIVIFIIVHGIWVIRVAYLYDHFLTVVGF